MKKEKYLQIFNYLKEFSKLRSNPVRDIIAQDTQYPEIFWLNDIPEHELFENIIRPDFNLENDYWLKIRKPKEPEKPNFSKLSLNLEKWVEPSSLLNEEEEPFLKETIESNNETLSLEDFPGIIGELKKYVNEKWIDDLILYNSRFEKFEKEHEVFDRLNNIYKQLFQIFNKTEQFGEEYELVLGIGLLNFKEDDKCPKLFRHIFTQRVDISYEYSLKDSHILVSPNLESYPQIETDSILDLFEQFDSQNIIDAEKAVETYIKEKEIDSLFDSGLMEDALQMFAERVSPDGSYQNKIEKPSITPTKPIIFFSPALLLRKRNTRSFTALYEKILKDIENGNEDLEIPQIDDLIGISKKTESDYSNSATENFDFENEPILFPKEYNDEQIEIIERARRKNKVLVQGPPGTGKSHTIANIICHLLANGKKVLITAYTKRALEVLKEKLPPEFQDLAVNLLSGDSSSIQDLQKSVNSINEELSRANLKTYQYEIENFEEELKKVREKIAFNTNELIKIKEKATRKQSINAFYSGTLLEIAEILELDLPKYDWYHDAFCDIENERIISDLKTFIDLFEIYKNIDVSEFDLILPDTDRIPSIEQIKEYKQLEESLFQYNNSKDEHVLIECTDFNHLKIMLNELSELYTHVNSLQIDFTDKFIKSYLNGEAFQWKQKIEDSSQILSGIPKPEELKVIDRDIEITYGSEKSLIQLKSDAQILLNYLKEGNSLSGLAFTLKKAILPKEIKERLFFVDSIRVNGSPCDTIKEFENVIRDIKLKQDIEEVSQIWKTEIPQGKYYLNKFNFFKNINSEVIKLIKIIEQAEILRLDIVKYSSLNIEPFDNKRVISLINEIEYNQLLQKHSVCKELYKTCEAYLNQKSFHPIKEKILKNIKQIHYHGYAETLSELGSITTNKNNYQNYKQLKTRLESILPKLLESIFLCDFSISDIIKFEQAVLFRHAQNEINKLMDIDYEQNLFSDLKEHENKEKKLIAKLAAKKAWFKVVESLQQNRTLRQHLDAWVMAVKKIGKTGKGKRAMKFRKIAQQEMEHCKDSIPCWIMPLYKVAETIRPEQGMYDYVIIDEASQLGPDAIFLLYISKNIIIVGDDKQTSPEYVGVDANIMNPHIKRHLSGIPRSDFYGTEFSFFDHAKFFCDGVTVLREHFRCMPEIIEFSNKHFYAPDGKGLYPLKQYSENRLDPLKTVFCPNGNTVGTGAKIINEPEANAIVETITKLLADPRYNNKKFGVITLQGNQQSNLIENFLLKKIGEQEYHKRKIICGNSASFQGDERDIIFLSLVTAYNHNRSALVKPEDERRFNVAVSRAKEQIWLFHSVQLEDLGNINDLRYKLLNHFKNHNSKQVILSNPIERNSGTQPDPFDSWFEVDVYNDIVRKNLSVIPQYEVAKGKYRIDLVALFPDGTKIAIECDGDKWHGAEHHQNDLMRQKVLERCGWQFFRVRGYEYYTNRVKALEPLWAMIPKKRNVERESATSNFDFERKDEYNPEQSNTASSVLVSQRLDLNVLTGGQLGNDSDNENKFENSTDQSQILRYFNLFKSGSYVLTSEKPLESDFIIPIKATHRNGYLLQCYNSGHINKVRISVLLSRKIDKEYMNGLNVDDSLKYLKIIESEKIIGLSFKNNRSLRFKAHLTENISSRELLYLQGYKVMYCEFEDLEYTVLPLEIFNDINRLVFQSFNASGKAVGNDYYAKEWSVLEKFYQIQTSHKIEISDEENSDQESNTLIIQTQTLNVVKKNSIVKIRYINSDKVLQVQLSDYPTKMLNNTNGIQKININSPLAVSIIGKSIGEKVKVGAIDNYVEIVEISN